MLCSPLLSPSTVWATPSSVIAETCHELRQPDSPAQRLPSAQAIPSAEGLHGQGVKEPVCNF